MTVVGCIRPTTTSTTTTGLIAIPNKIDTMNANIDTTNTAKTLIGDTIVAKPKYKK